MISLELARKFVLDRVRVLEPQLWPIGDVSGCVIAEHVVASEAIPSFENSSMDGFAFRANDTVGGGARLRVLKSINAGHTFIRTVAAGEAVRIMTGAPLPEGADCVCKVEEARVEGDHVVIPRVVHVGEFVRHVAEDVALGQILLSPGDELNAASIGVLAGQGIDSVRVHPRPRVGILSTGDELSRTAGPLEAGHIRDLNRPMLLSLLRDCGFVAVDLGTSRDSREAITESLLQGVERCDAVISTGGVSMGDVDFVKAVIGDLGGADATWMQVAIRPGKPFAFGLVGERGTPVFGLPGNPVSTKVSFEMFVRPALRAMGAHQVRERLTLIAELDVSIEDSLDEKIHLVHVKVQLDARGNLHVTDVKRFGSHLLNAVAGANALAVVCPGTSYGAGQTVNVILLETESIGAAS